ncbi:hypothetical protein GCM10010415_69080 [Streptomyces atrovirens]
MAADSRPAASAAWAGTAQATVARTAVARTAAAVQRSVRIMLVSIPCVSQCRCDDAHGASGAFSSPGPVRVPRAFRPLLRENHHATPAVRIRPGQEAAWQGVAHAAEAVRGTAYP